MKNFNEIIESLKPEYLSDVSWGYKYEKYDFVIDFYQDELGKNIIEQFCKKIKNEWINVEPTDAQLKTMFEKLNRTPYKEIELHNYMPWENETWENGHSKNDFY